MLNNGDNYIFSIENSFVKIAFLSDIGGRNEQQDCSGYEMTESEVVAVLCDGMGGHNGGRLASNSSVGLFLDNYRIQYPIAEKTDFFINTLKSINREICNLKDEEGNLLKCGSTFTSIIVNTHEINWVSVGDSHIYLIREDVMERISEEHIFQNRLNLYYESGEITKQEFERDSRERGEILTSFLGVGELKEISYNSEPLYSHKNDILVMCSDGLYKFLSEDKIKLIIENFSNPEDALRALLSKVKSETRKKESNGDNVTVALIKIK